MKVVTICLSLLAIITFAGTALTEPVSMRNNSEEPNAVNSTDEKCSESAPTGEVIGTHIGIAYYPWLVMSTFDDDLDGWLMVSPNSGELVWEELGGNPGGFSHFSDANSETGFIRAPDKFLGDWSALDGNAFLSWDNIVLELGLNPDLRNPKAIIYGSDGSVASFTSEEFPNPDEWLTTVVPIEESYWVISHGTWSGLLEDVTDLRIQIELVANPGSAPSDEDGIDNVILFIPW